MGGQDASAAQGNQPGGGIGNPIGTPDPLSKYKWWILGGLGLLLAAAAAFLLRKPVAVRLEAARFTTLGQSRIRRSARRLPSIRSCLAR